MGQNFFVIFIFKCPTTKRLLPCKFSPCENLVTLVCKFFLNDSYSFLHILISMVASVQTEILSPHHFHFRLGTCELKGCGYKSCPCGETKKLGSIDKHGSSSLINGLVTHHNYRFLFCSQVQDGYICMHLHIRV